MADIVHNVTKLLPRRISSPGLWALMLAIYAVQFAAMATHVWASANRHEWWLLVLGTIIYPWGLTHGAGVWFGVWS